MTMRLTKATVENIARKVVKHRFSADVLTARSAEAELFNQAWEALYTKAERDFLLSAPEGFVATTAMLRTRVGGQNHELHARGHGYGEFSFALSEDDAKKLALLPMSVRCAVRHDRGMNADNLVFAADAGGLPAAIVAAAIERGKLSQTIRDAEAKVVSALNGTTRAKAILLWPEIEPFLPVENKPAGLPALPTKELNALLDLPVSEAA